MLAAQQKKTSPVAKEDLATETDPLHSEPSAKRAKLFDTENAGIKDALPEQECPEKNALDRREDATPAPKIGTTSKQSSSNSLTFPGCYHVSELDAWMRNNPNKFGQKWKIMVKGFNITPRKHLFLVLRNQGNNPIPNFQLSPNEKGILNLCLPVSRDEADKLNSFQLNILDELAQQQPDMFPSGSTVEKNLLARFPKNDDGRFSPLVNAKFEPVQVNQQLQQESFNTPASSASPCSFSMVGTDGKIAKLSQIDITQTLPGSMWNFAIVHVKHVCQTNGKWNVSLKLKALQLVENTSDSVDFDFLSLLAGGSDE